MFGKSSLILTILLASFTASAWAQDTVLLPQGTRLSLQLNDPLSTKLNKEGDSFTARVITPVYDRDTVVIPKGSLITGNVSRVLRPGRFQGKAVMNLLFHSVQIPGIPGSLPVVASLVRLDPEGNAGAGPENAVSGKGSKGRDTVRVASPALLGAGIGALVGGGKGSAVGAGIGVAAGITSILATRGKDLEVRRGSTMDITLDRPLAIPLAEKAGTRRNP